MKKRVLRKEFFITLFIKQNKWHRYSVFRHTIMVAYYALRDKNYKMIPAALLHDIGKPYVAFQDEEDKLTAQYSFTNHEEIGYQLIKNNPLISEYTKKLVRYHYLIRGKNVAKRKDKIGRYNRLSKILDKLDDNFKKDLEIFLKYDDLAK